MILNFGRLEVDRNTFKIIESRLELPRAHLEPFEIWDRWGWTLI